MGVVEPVGIFVGTTDCLAVSHRQLVSGVLRLKLSLIQGASSESRTIIHFAHLGLGLVYFLLAYPRRMSVEILFEYLYRCDFAVVEPLSCDMTTAAQIFRPIIISIAAAFRQLSRLHYGRQQI